MPHSDERSLGPVTQLPNPELNPMLNPTLGRNLGRWAHVYFTSPPEKREQAVLELLRELENESGNGGAQAPLTTAANSNIPVLEAPMTPELVSCAECGHKNAPQQRFCGMCGSSLRLDDAMSVDSDAEPLPTSLASQRRIETEAPAVHEQVFPTLSLFAQVGEDASRSGDRRSDIHWLRDRDDLERENASSPALKYVLVLFAVLLAAAYFYNRSKETRGPGAQGPSGVWTGTQSQAEPRAQTPPPTAPVATPQPPVTTSEPNQESTSKKLDSLPAATSASNAETLRQAPPSEGSSSNTPPTATPSAAAVASKQAVAARTAPVKPTSRPELSAPAQEASPADNGTAELAIAEGYLMGKRGPRNSAVAATFLWKAVSKENTTATLLLSDLYRTGDGVPKSCDQARVLLHAAARKNIPEAGRKLRDLQGGCP